MINTLQALVEEEAEQIFLEQVVCLNVLIPTIRILHSRIEEEVMVVVVMVGHQEVGIIRTRIIKNSVEVTEVGVRLFTAMQIILLISQHHMTLMIQVVPAAALGEHQIIETGQNRDLAEEEEDHQNTTIQEEEEEHKEEEDKEEARKKDLECKFNTDVRYK